MICCGHRNLYIGTSSRSFLVLKINHVSILKVFGGGGLSDFKTILVHLKGYRKITHRLSKNSIVVATLLGHICIFDKVRGSLYMNIAYLTLHCSIVVVSLLNHICIFWTSTYTVHIKNASSIRKYIKKRKERCFCRQLNQQVVRVKR